ncbi:MAG TPA: hypothetical protein VIL07_07945 [Symbiobacteriaceae bacterium]
MPHQFRQKVEPIVRHGLRELRAGAPVDHVLREVALMAALVGTGLSASEAIRAVERAEPQLLGLPRGEEWEGWHWSPPSPLPLRPVPMPGWPFGKGSQVPTGPWGMGKMGG